MGRHNQIDHILTDGRRHSSIRDVRSFRGANCNTDHYLVVSKVRQRLAVSKQVALKFDVERFTLRRLNELEVGKQYQIEILNRLEALENLNDVEDINKVSENIRENIKTSAKDSPRLYELKQRKPWFDKECSQFLDQSK
jgi:hypothetical protein